MDDAVDDTAMMDTVPSAAAAASPGHSHDATSDAEAARAHSAAAAPTSAAAAAADAAAASLECPSCRCLYTHPLSLSCSHTMCLECCRHWAATSSEIEAASIDSTLAMLGVTDADFHAIHGGKPVEGRSADTKQLGVPRFMDRVSDWSARCHVCMGVAKPYKDLVLCDSCDLPVHEACYGIDNLSDDSDAEWHCDPCKDARAHGGVMAHPAATRNAGQRSLDAYSAKENYRKGASAASASSSSAAAAVAAPSRSHQKKPAAPSSAAAASASSSSAAAPPIIRSRKQARKKMPSSSTSARCCVCSNKDDLAFYPVEGGGWIHVSCAAFLEGPDGCGHENDNLVRGVDEIGPQWFRLQCAFCDEPGATVQCKYGKCLKSYHVPCGIRYGCLFTNKLVKGESGLSSDNVCYRDSVCPLHRKHMETVANQHDPRILAAQRKAKQQKGRKGCKQTAMPCPVCRKVTHLSLARTNLGLRPAADLQARADAHRLAHPEEEEDLAELMSKYRNSRPHDSSSDSDDEETEDAKSSSRAAAASHAASSSAAAAAAPVRSRSGASVTSRTRSPGRPAPAAAAAASRSPARARAVRTPVEASVSPSSLTSTLSRPARMARQRSTSPPSAPLTPSKRKTAAAAEAAAAAAPAAMVPRRRPSSVLAAASPFSDVGDADDDDADEEMNVFRHMATVSSSSSSAAAAPTMAPRMLRCYSEPAHATSAASSSSAAAAGSSPSSSVHPQPATPSSTPLSSPDGLRVPAAASSSSAAAASTVTGGSGSSTRSSAASSRLSRVARNHASSLFDSSLSLDIDGLEILDCKLSTAAGGRPSQARKKLRLTEAQQQPANQARAKQRAPAAAAAAAMSDAHPAAAAGAADDEAGDCDDDDDEAEAEDAAPAAADSADDQVSQEQDVLMRLESLDSSITEQFDVLMPAQNHALLHPELRSRLSNLRATLREQSMLAHNTLRAPTRDRVPIVIASLEQSLSLLMRAYLGDAAPTRRVSVRHPKVGLVSELDHLIGGLIDPMLAR